MLNILNVIKTHRVVSVVTYNKTVYLYVMEYTLNIKYINLNKKE
jgi:hypothetical protein